MKKLPYSTIIQAPRQIVWDTMLSPDTYRQWTSGFCAGSYYEGSWEKGSCLKFLSPSGEGMRAEIAENRPLEHLSIRHLACIQATGEELFPEPAYENYTFRDSGTGTELQVEMDTDEKYEAMFTEMWPRALKLLKILCEEKHTHQPTPINIMSNKRNPIGWFEIYVNDMPRAKAFYEAVFATKLEALGNPTADDAGLEMWMFPGGPEQFGCNGSLCKMDGCAAGGGGTLIYFSCEDCAVEAARVTPNGGTLYKEKFAIGDYGFIAIACDTEGNTIGLHSMK